MAKIWNHTGSTKSRRLLQKFSRIQYLEGVIFKEETIESFIQNVQAKIGFEENLSSDSIRADPS
jgi:hypothetical protein